MSQTIVKTEFNFPGQKSVYHGKVREVYSINEDQLMMVVSDRISELGLVLTLELISELIVDPIPGPGLISELISEMIPELISELISELIPELLLKLTFKQLTQTAPTSRW